MKKSCIAASQLDITSQWLKRYFIEKPHHCFLWNLSNFLLPLPKHKKKSRSFHALSTLKIIVQRPIGVWCWKRFGEMVVPYNLLLTSCAQIRRRESQSRWRVLRRVVKGGVVGCLFLGETMGGDGDVGISWGGWVVSCNPGVGLLVFIDWHWCCMFFSVGKTVCWYLSVSRQFMFFIWLG